MKGRLNKEQVERLLELLSKKLEEPKNSQIRQSLRKMLDNADLRELRDVMHLSGYRSVDYSFIKEEILRTQLEVDNLRMEDAAHSTQIKDDEERFFIFCVHAFYQIENITNYYLVKKLPNFTDLMAYMEEHSNFKHKVHPKTQEIIEKNVGDIEISNKIFALCGELFPYDEKNKDFTYSIISRLRDVRNEGSHRCQIIGTTSNEKLLEFYKRQDYATVRETLRKYIDVIRNKIQLPAQIQEELSEYIELPDTRHGFEKEIIETLTSAKLKHYVSKDGKYNSWEIVLSDSIDTVRIKVPERYFVKKYWLSDGDNILSMLPPLQFYRAIHKDHIERWNDANNQYSLDPTSSETMKKYHIEIIAEIIKD